MDQPDLLDHPGPAGPHFRGSGFLVQPATGELQFGEPGVQLAASETDEACEKVTVAVDDFADLGEGEPDLTKDEDSPYADRVVRPVASMASGRACRPDQSDPVVVAQSAHTRPDGSGELPDGPHVGWSLHASKART